jgi:hypothetical protein
MPRNQRSAVLVTPLRNGPRNPHDPQAFDALMIALMILREASEEFLRREQGMPELSREALMELEVPEDEAQS